MNDFEKAPRLEETLIETIFEYVSLEDQTGEDDIAISRSNLLKLQYENATKEKKEAMNVFAMCLTGMNMDAIIEKNKERNQTNCNVG